MKTINLICCVLYLNIFTVAAQFAENSKNYQKFTGYFNFFHDQKTDKIYLEVDKLNSEFLYVYALSSGIGSNDIGLDRGQLGNEQVVYFKKAGNKLLLVQPNLKYSALTDNKLEKKSVEQAFATSVLYGFKIEDEKNGTYIIDITGFLMQDAHGVSGRLKKRKQGSFSLDKSKSAVDLERTKAFPKNIEIDLMLTFKGEGIGRELRSVAPNPNLVTVSQHHSFIALPDSDFEMRAYDPRSGSYPFSYYDYSTPVQEPTLQQFIRRHRLKKKNPEAKVSEAVEPIIYYLDNGTPEPVRSALLEGGKWWNQAFEAIGYKNAFQLKMLPDDADPLDSRYNVIQWVHRSTRGWSYGSSIVDPRTGEIIKGHVSLGSLRIRQDFLIAQALMNQPFKNRDDNYEPMLALALARIRQLSAHEIGHTLGFAHNFAASTNNRASVMDYPHPQFSIKKGKIDFSNAYATGIGEWDKVAVAYSYSDFTNDKNEKVALNKILKDAQDNKLRYITDQDSRPKGITNGLSHLWDNGKSATEELEAVLDVRALAIKNFSIDNIKTGETYSNLEDVFVPLYLFHRYQVEATSKLIGGIDFNYATKGDDQTVVKPIASKVQKEALESVLKTLDASVIKIPKDKLELFPPRAFGKPRTRESFKSKTGIAFDPISAAETASDLTLEFLLHPERASNLMLQKSLDDKFIGLDELLTEVVDATFNKKGADNYSKEVQYAINYRVLYYIMNLAVNKKVHGQVNAIANFKLQELKNKYQQKQDAFSFEIVNRIKQFQEQPESFKIIPVDKIPDGSPIGMDCY
ncbi:zinc-dependent metalloprotease [Cellulophaga baltica]|uniref:zinc-dependent metalloprotease n=1 Tax=Cellulophaga TaxID=104264 RepID=UPI001C0664A2|nr:MULTISPECIES: zinc-dependent metalloprotease [Cellulophaga]MBU2996125.1 zinc-dependent metalloprotease [Cellulophaga baltica]MDO6767520.1 zinc-dependent metalloprotease [Cellulophaga sp. 1_MG-2023]